MTYAGWGTEGSTTKDGVFLHRKETATMGAKLTKRKYLRGQNIRSIQLVRV